MIRKRIEEDGKGIEEEEDDKKENRRRGWKGNRRRGWKGKGNKLKDLKRKFRPS